MDGVMLDGILVVPVKMVGDDEVWIMPGGEETKDFKIVSRYINWLKKEQKHKVAYRRK